MPEIGQSLSQIITLLAESYSEELLGKLKIAFGSSIFGLMMDGLSDAKPGQTITIDGSRAVTMPSVKDSYGKLLIKLCADPDVFNVNYPGTFNVTMSGRQVIDMAQKMPNADGILICSATSFNSFPIYKDAYRYFLGDVTSANKRKWWQLLGFKLHNGAILI